MADLHKLESSDEAHLESPLVFLLLCATCGVPTSWNKTEGADTEVWVGYEPLHRGRRLGIRKRRAEWFIRCGEEAADSEYVHMTSLEEVVGRTKYFAGALKYEHSFLSLCTNS